APAKPGASAANASRKQAKVRRMLPTKNNRFLMTKLSRSRSSVHILPASMASSQIDAGASARTRIAARLLPFLFLLYVANYIDRTNIAYATLGMKGDLHLSDSVFGTASGIFFIGYFALQIPGALLVERWSARLLLAITLITWGALTTLTGFVHSAQELYGARFLLGAAEAGVFPGVLGYLS